MTRPKKEDMKTRTMKTVNSPDELEGINLDDVAMVAGPPVPEQTTFDDWRDMAFDGIDVVGGSLKPDADWMPVILMDCDKGFVVFPLQGDDQGREGLAEVASAVTSLDPRYACRIEMAWAADYVAGNDEAPSERADKREVLLAQIAQKGGEHEFWMGEVVRDGVKPPQIVKWELKPAAGPLADAFERMMK
jgi:hypothetical protein